MSGDMLLRMRRTKVDWGFYQVLSKALGDMALMCDIFET